MTEGRPITVFSTDDSRYQQWQAELLMYSHRRVEMRGSVIRLVSGQATRADLGPHEVHVPAFEEIIGADDWYPPLNRILALIQWLRSPEIKGDLLLLDPDCVFVAPLDLKVCKGSPIGQRIGYLCPYRRTALAQAHCRGPVSIVQPVGIPLLIDADDLRGIVHGWLERTLEIREADRSRAPRERAGWVAEMWAYAFVTAEAGLRHDLQDIAARQWQAIRERPLIHYCYAWDDSSAQWSWNKRLYQPWNWPELPPKEAPEATQRLIGLLRAYIAEEAHQSRIRHQPAAP